MDAPGGQEEPKWKVLRGVYRQSTLPLTLGGVKDGGNVLEAVAPKKLMVDMAEAAEMKCGYAYPDIIDVVCHTWLSKWVSRCTHLASPTRRSQTCRHWSPASSRAVRGAECNFPSRRCARMVSSGPRVHRAFSSDARPAAMGSIPHDGVTR